MAKFNVIDALTGEVKYSGAPKYNGVYCKPSYLEFTEIASPVPIDWRVGDYVVYPRTGLTYRLYDLPQPKKQSRRTEYGGAFVYQNVQFFADTKWLEIETFRDIVLGDNDIHFSTRESWSVWTNVANLLDRMQAVMDASSSARFTFRLVDATQGSDLHDLLHNNYQDFSVSGDSVLAGLEKIYEQWGNIGWLHTVENGVNIITVGIPPIRVNGIGTDTSDEFIYGKGHALTSLRKTAVNKNELRTRLFVYGSTRNMIPRYYNNLTPYIKDHESVDIQHLMIPLSEWGLTSGERDAAKAYLENNVSEFGVRPDSVYFDGSELEEIYPSIAKATVGNLYDSMEAGAQYRPDLTKWDRDDRLDEVVSVSGVVDDGQQSLGGSRYTQIQYYDTLPYVADEYENFSRYLIDGYHLDYAGKITVDFRGLEATLTDNNGMVQAFDCTLVAQAGGRRTAVDVVWTKRGNVYTLSLPEVSLTCNAGENLFVSILVNFRTSRATAPVAFSVMSRSAAIQYTHNYPGTFVIRIPQIGFDIATRSNLGSEGIATIAMRDGMCGGRSFAVKSCAYVPSADAWDITVYRGKDESLDMLFPNTGFPISAGDHFVILDIAMPDTYIGIAEQRLLAAGQALLDDVSRIKPFYEPEINSKYVYENGLALREGWYMPVKDSDITGGATEYILIDTLSINEGESNIPTYKVTLREQKRTSYANTGTSSGDTSMTSLANGGASETKAGGTVSVGLTMPEQFSVEGSPVAGMGTIAVSLNPLYAIPTAYQVAAIDALASMFEVKSYASGKWALHVKPAALDSSGTMRTIDGIFSDGFVSAGGIGPGGGGGEGGINTIAFGSKSYSAQAGSTAIIIPTSGTDSVKTPLGITSLESRVTVLENRPQGGVTSLGGATGAIAVRGGQTANGSVNLTMSGTQLQASIVGLGALAYQSSVAAALGYTPYNAASIGGATVAYAAQVSRKNTGKALSAINAVASSADLWNDRGNSWVFENYNNALAITVGGVSNDRVANIQVGHSATQYGSALGALYLNKLGGAVYIGNGNTVYHSGNLTSLSQLGQDAGHRLVTDAQITLWTKITNLFDTDTDGNVYVKNNKGFYSYSFITAGGSGSGGSGSTGALYTCVDVTAYNNEKVGRDSTHPAQQGDLLAYDGTHWHAAVPPATGVTTFGGRGGAITLGSNLAMNGNQLGLTGVITTSNIASQTVAYAAQVSRKNTGKALSAINAVASSADLWNDRGNSWVFENYNNALAITVGGVSNDRVANIQVGHSATQYGSALGALYLNKLGGEVYIGSGLAIHSGNYTAYCATAAQGAKADAAYGWGNHASAGYAAASALSSHIGNKSNPHAVTKAQVGLGNVDNTADANKSVARAHGLTSVQITASFDLNTALSGGGVTGNYGDTNYWVNGPSGMGYGSVAQIQASTGRGDQLALQLAWDIGHNSTSSTKRLWFRSSNNLGWQADWKEIYHSGNSNKSDVAWTCSTLTANNKAILGSLYNNSAALGRALSYGAMIGCGSVYGVAIWSTSNGNGHIQAQRFDGTATAYNLCLQELGGNVGLGTTSPSQKLHVVGNIVATGAITAGAASDARLKDNIRNLANAVTVLKSLRPVSFDWNATATGNYSALKGHDVGLVAQEVEPYIPSAVGTIFGDYKRLDYTKVTPYLIAGWQDHESRIAALEKENAELKRRLNIN